MGPFASVEKGRETVRDITGQINSAGVVMVSTQPGGMTASSELERQVRTASAAGAGGCNFYNYGLLREEQLEFVGSSLRRL